MNIRLKHIILLLMIQFGLNAQTDDSGSIRIGKKVMIHSSVLDESREIYIHEPIGYEQMDNIPVVFVLDAYSQFKQTVSTIEYLSAASQGNDVLPVSLVIGITNPNRNFDLTPVKGILGNDPSTISNTGGGSVFLEFITTELIPYIDRTYNTCNHRTIIGHSLGGLLVFQALLEKREYFNNYLTIDPGLGFANRVYLNEVLDTIRSANLSTEQFYFASANNRPTFMGVEELQSDTDRFLELCDRPNADFRHLNETEEWMINISEKHYSNEDHFSVPFMATYDAFQYFYRYYKFKEMFDYRHHRNSLKSDLLIKLKNHYHNISKKMGCNAKPSEGYVNSWAWGLAMSEREDLAMELFNYNIELYPNRPSSYSNFGRYLQKSGLRERALDQYRKSLKLQNDEDIQSIADALMNEIDEHNNR